MARQRQQKEGRWAFLSGGKGAAYYRWKVRCDKIYDFSAMLCVTAVGHAASCSSCSSAIAALHSCTPALTASFPFLDAGALAAQHDPAPAAPQPASHWAALGAAVGRRARRPAWGAAAGLGCWCQLGGWGGRAGGGRPGRAAAAGPAPPAAAGGRERQAAPAAPAEPQLCGCRVEGHAAARCRRRCCGGPATRRAAAASAPRSRACASSQGGHRSRPRKASRLCRAGAGLWQRPRAACAGSGWAAAAAAAPAGPAQRGVAASGAAVQALQRPRPLPRAPRRAAGEAAREPPVCRQVPAIFPAVSAESLPALLASSP